MGVNHRAPRRPFAETFVGRHQRELFFCLPAATRRETSRSPRPVSRMRSNHDIHSLLPPSPSLTLDWMIPASTSTPMLFPHTTVHRFFPAQRGSVNKRALAVVRGISGGSCPACRWRVWPSQRSQRPPRPQPPGRQTCTRAHTVSVLRPQCTSVGQWLLPRWNEQYLVVVLEHPKHSVGDLLLSHTNPLVHVRPADRQSDCRVELKCQPHSQPHSQPHGGPCGEVVCGTPTSPTFNPTGGSVRERRLVQELALAQEVISA